MDDPCQLQLMVEKKWMLFLDMLDTLNFRLLKQSAWGYWNLMTFRFMQTWRITHICSLSIVYILEQ